MRGAEPAPRDVAIVGIDDATFSALGRRWPFPRRLDGRVIDVLHADGAKAIAFDVQFTEPSNYYANDYALYRAVAAARSVVLATTDVNASGQSNVLGGPANLRRAHPVAAAANLPADAGGIIRRYPYRMLGLPSFAVAAARVAGDRIDPSHCHHDSALIDFRGPPGTIREYPFADVLRHRVDLRAFAGKIVVIGAVSPTLQDLHPTSTTASNPMSGAEVQASAIWTALPATPSLAPLGGSRSPPSCLVQPSRRSRRCGCGSRPQPASRCSRPVSICSSYSAFDAGTVLSVTYPLAAWIAGALGMFAEHYAAAMAERNVFSRQLAESQLELVQRLAHAVESRDSETSEHIHRIGVLCRRLARQIGWSDAEAEMIMHASIAHDIGKIGISDSILLKPGPLDPEEWRVMKTHTTIGAEPLAGSPSALIQMAEEIALSHHERWDGTGYPRGLAEIIRSAGTHFDPRLIDAFLQFAPELTAQLSASFVREEMRAPREFSAVREAQPPRARWRSTARAVRSPLNIAPCSEAVSR